MKIDRLSSFGIPATKRSARNGSTKSGDFAKALALGDDAPPVSPVGGGAALAVSGPVQHFGRETRERFAAHVREAAGQIAARLEGSSS